MFGCAKLSCNLVDLSYAFNEKLFEIRIPLIICNYNHRSSIYTHMTLQDLEFNSEHISEKMKFKYDMLYISFTVAEFVFRLINAKYRRSRPFLLLTWLKY